MSLEIEIGDVREHPERLPSAIDFLLLDSKHTYGFAKWYFNTVIPRVDHGAPIVIHDIASGLPVPGPGGPIWTGHLAPFTEAWKVRRELKSRRIGHYTLNGAVHPWSVRNGNALNNRLIRFTRIQAGLTNSPSPTDRNPSIFFFATSY